jgi:hypothetical protein
MKKFRLVNATVHAGLALLGFQFLKWFLSHPEAAIKLHDAFPLLKNIQDFVPLAVAGILVGAFRYSDGVSRWIIEDIPLVSKALRKLLSRSTFAEGDWPLVVVHGATGDLGFATIGYGNEQLTIAGRDWRPGGTFVHDFEAIQTRVTGNRLQYWYEQGHLGELRGYTEVHFFPKDARRERLTGRFSDDMHPNVRI